MPKRSPQPYASPKDPWPSVDAAQLYAHARVAKKLDATCSARLREDLASRTHLRLALARYFVSNNIDATGPTNRPVCEKAIDACWESIRDAAAGKAGRLGRGWAAGARVLGAFTRHRFGWADGVERHPSMAGSRRRRRSNAQDGPRVRLVAGRACAPCNSLDGIKRVGCEVPRSLSRREDRKDEFIAAWRRVEPGDADAVVVFVEPRGPAPSFLFQPLLQGRVEDHELVPYVAYARHAGLPKYGTLALCLSNALREGIRKFDGASARLGSASVKSSTPASPGARGRRSRRCQRVGRLRAGAADHAARLSPGVDGDRPLLRRHRFFIFGVAAGDSRQR